MHTTKIFITYVWGYYQVTVGNFFHARFFIPYDLIFISCYCKQFHYISTDMPFQTYTAGQMPPCLQHQVLIYICSARDAKRFGSKEGRGAERIGNYGKSLSEISGTLKLAIPDSILIYTMQPFLQAFRREAPNVQLAIQSLQAGGIVSAIVDGSADIGINCEKDSYPDTVIHKKLGQYKAVLVASPLADKSLLDFITPHQRKPLSLICNEPDGYYQLDLEKYLAEKDIVLNPHMKVQSIEAVKRCVANQLGIAVVPTYSIGEELKNGSLIPIKTGLDEKSYDSVYLYHKNKWISPQMELALRLLGNINPDKPLSKC